MTIAKGNKMGEWTKTIDPVTGFTQISGKFALLMEIQDENSLKTE